MLKRLANRGSKGVFSNSLLNVSTCKFLWPALASCHSPVQFAPYGSSLIARDKDRGRDEFEDNEENDDDDDDDSGESNNDTYLYKKYDILKELDVKQDLSQAMKPKQIVEELNRHIVGQDEAKKAVAIALRNRWRRQQLPEEVRNEVLPKNILMIGPTGVGKTEIARRMAKLADAPFIKVEATKYTEVGFHGKDVDTIIKDLVDLSVQQTKERMKKRLKSKIQNIVEERILECLLGNNSTEQTKETFSKMLRSGELDEREIEIEMPQKPHKPPAFATSYGSGNEGVITDIGGLFSHLERIVGRRGNRKRKMKIGKCKSLIEEIELERAVSMENVIKEALRSVEQEGVVFVDEIDKICTGYHEQHDASAEGVQRDLLPIIEGTTVNTKYGNVNTDHILFIASGAFHNVKPADMLAELQGRLPIRVELKGLTEHDLYRILTEPENNLLRQNIALLDTEKVILGFKEEAVREIASVAAELNTTVENIGARRLITVVEKLLEDVSFNAPEMAGQTVSIEKDDVRKYVGELIKKSDLSKFVL